MSQATTSHSKTAGNSLVPQNLGWLDRLLRFIVATAMMVSAITFLYVTSATPAWLEDGSPMAWPYYVMLIAIYPFVTAIIGRDPVYGLLKIKSCGNSPRNPCGTFPFEVTAASGQDVEPQDDVDHSLVNSKINESKS